MSRKEAFKEALEEVMSEYRDLPESEYIEALYGAIDEWDALQELRYVREGLD